ncbi:hypothetical protein [Deinococcus sp.]|uniref:hypothetical protein n=1 Tax=Deinococcus sp. TaxID=47478 RepID=UPI0025EBB5AF|nr:hypothetical protein [Deinococcus sp.]
MPRVESSLDADCSDSLSAALPVGALWRLLEPFVLNARPVRIKGRDRGVQPSTG